MSKPKVAPSSKWKDPLMDVAYAAFKADCEAEGKEWIEPSINSWYPITRNQMWFVVMFYDEEDRLLGVYRVACDDDDLCTCDVQQLKPQQRVEYQCEDC